MGGAHRGRARRLQRYDRWPCDRWGAQSRLSATLADHRTHAYLCAAFSALKTASFARSRRMRAAPWNMVRRESTWVSIADCASVIRWSRCWMLACISCVRCSVAERAADKASCSRRSRPTCPTPSLVNAPRSSSHPVPQRGRTVDSSCRRVHSAVAHACFALASSSAIAFLSCALIISRCTPSAACSPRPAPARPTGRASADARARSSSSRRRAWRCWVRALTCPRRPCPAPPSHQVRHRVARSPRSGVRRRSQASLCKEYDRGSLRQ